MGVWKTQVLFLRLMKELTFTPQDTAGSERYEAMSRIYYRGAKAAIVCYDLTDSSSFERAKFWVKELRSLEEVGDQIPQIGDRDHVDLWR